MQALSIALFPLFIVGITEFVNALRKKDYKSAETIGIAAVVGLAAGFIHLGGLDPVAGLTVAFQGVGIVTTAQNFPSKK